MEQKVTIPCGNIQLEGLFERSPKKDDIQRVLMVAPPVTFMDFSATAPPLENTHTITGDLDAFAPPKAVKRWLFACGLPDIVTIVKGADHFYSGRLHQLEAAISENVAP